MPTAIHKKWHLLPTGQPGHRFRNRYRQQQKSKNRGIGPKILRFFLAGVCAVIGVILVFIPGPAVLFFLIGGALLAADWLPVAKLLDWSEVRLRKLWTRARKFWARLSKPARVALVVTGALLGAATSFGFYQLMR